MTRYLRLDTGLCIVVATMAFSASGTHPYSYFMLLRWFACVMAGYLSWRLYQSKRSGLAVLFGIVAIVFNPIAPIRFSRATWEPIDLIAGVIFLIGAFLTGKLPTQEPT